MLRSPRRVVAVLAAGMVLAACGAGDVATVPVDAPISKVPASTVPGTTAPPSTIPATTTATTAAVPPTTTIPATTTTTTAAPTTTEALPVPAPVPGPGTKEPVSEVGLIEIPRIGVSMTMFSGVTEATLDLGPGHWPGTAMPGHVGNVVVAGHRVSHHRVFRNIDQLQPGDEIIFTVDGARTVYEVVSSEVVRPEAVWIIDQTREHTATLFACHPPGSTRERLVVHARLRIET